MMSQRVERPQSPDVEEGKIQLQEHLAQALSLADALALPPEVGARIQEVIDLFETCTNPTGEAD